MDRKIVVLSGPVSSGKSTLSEKLAGELGGIVIKTNQYVKNLVSNSGANVTRDALQKKGTSLDQKTKGRWVVDYIQECLAQGDHENGSSVESKLVIVDSVRIAKQIQALRDAYGRDVLHVHLEASDGTLSKRYHARSDRTVKELAKYRDVSNDATERKARKLGEEADIVIDTERCTEEDVFIKAISFLRSDKHLVEALVDVLVGGQYGSEGKGNIAAYISPEYDVLVRVGGPNAGHKVYDEPRVQVFRHLPSGTRKAEHAKIILGPGAVIDVELLLQEIADNQVSYDRLVIDPKAVIIEKNDKKKEERKQKGIASTMKGVGEASARRITERSVRKKYIDEERRGRAGVRTAADISDLAPYVTPSAPVLEQAYRENKRILLEGTQGTALSLFHGPYPYVTSRDTTVAGCLAEAGISPKRVRKVILVCRTYPIRVGNVPGGNSGPMDQELEWEVISHRSGISIDELRETETTTATYRERRVAEFDWALFKQSVVLNAPTDIALTFIDYLDVENRKARRFEQLSSDSIRFIEDLERVSGVRVSLISTRFHYRSVIDRRNW